MLAARQTAAPPLPTELQVEVTAACNLSCRMCLVRYRPKLGRSQGAMSFETFRGLVDDLPGLEKVTLQGLGEPLLAPDLLRMVRYASERGVRMGFNTNGTLLTPARSRQLIEAGLGWLHVSLDGATAATYEGVRDGSDFERVRRHVIALVETRRRLGRDNPDLSLVFVAMRRNIGELLDVVRLADEWGVGRLWVQNLSHSFSDTDPAGAYAEIRAFAAAEALWATSDPATLEVFSRAQELAAGIGVDLRLPRLEEPPTARPPAGTPGCSWPWDSSYVTHDGKVQPCCMVMGADRAVLGDAKEDGFADIWGGDEYSRFRDGLMGDDPPDVCRGCSLYRRLF